MPRYHPAAIEPKWQRYWEVRRTFATPRLPARRAAKLYVLDMFPYPSGAGLHVGHPEGYTATDIVCRYQRMRGRSVMHPMGWDAFGLPAEQHAKKTGTPPRTTTEQNIATFRRQLKSLGFSYDWDRELATTDLGYFRWTQWIFLVLHDTWFDPDQQRGRPIAELPIPDEVRSAGEAAVRRYQDEHRLAYQQEALVNWCPALGTVLANEEVIGGVSERGGHPVVRMPLRQWMLRITAYADRLEKELDQVQWPQSIKTLQRNWIGRSEGAEVDFLLPPPPTAPSVNLPPPVPARRDGGGPGRGVGDESAREAIANAPSPQPSPGGRGGQSAAAFAAWKAERARKGFPRKPPEDVLRIYTTRPDTLFGATYMVLAPEHPYVDRLTTPEQAAAVRAYRERAAQKSDLDRTDLAKEKSGVFTGSFAINPVNGEAIPIWIADYVLMGYGTGAIMAVPAHDERDFQFAQQYGLAIRAVVDPGPDHPRRDAVLAGAECFVGDGAAINSSDKYNGLPTAEFKSRITANLASTGLGRGAVNYKLRDWLFSRQHFWGEPFPVLHELDDQGQPTGLARTVPADELPVDLPDMPHFKAHDTPEPPLEQAPADWLYPTIDGRRYQRETNTMPQWAGSCWYYLRFLDPRNDRAFVDPEVERAWMPVDLYIGGAEHAVLHLLYARFWHKVLYDRGHVSTPEPFARLVNQGMILGEVEIAGYQREGGAWVSAEQVEEDDDGNAIERATGEKLHWVRLKTEEATKKGHAFVHAQHPQVRLSARAYKMSKSRGNVVNPDAVVAEYGADSLRLYEMFMGPLEAVKPWSMEGVNGVRGFLDRVWRMLINDRAEQTELNPAVQDVPPTAEQRRVLHRTIRDVTEDLDQLAFNTAIARMMEFTNYFTRCEVRSRGCLTPFVLLLSPFAPHIAEELWQALGHSDTLAYEPWPSFDPQLCVEDTIEVPVQVNGKLRSKVQVPAGADEAALEAAARADAKIAELLAGKMVVKTVVVPGRLVNFVVKG